MRSGKNTISNETVRMVEMPNATFMVPLVFFLSFFASGWLFFFFFLEQRTPEVTTCQSMEVSTKSLHPGTSDSSSPCASPPSTTRYYCHGDAQCLSKLCVHFLSLLSSTDDETSWSLKRNATMILERLESGNRSRLSPVSFHLEVFTRVGEREKINFFVVGKFSLSPSICLRNCSFALAY